MTQTELLNLEPIRQQYEALWDHEIDDTAFAKRVDLVLDEVPKLLDEIERLQGIRQKYPERVWSHGTLIGQIERYVQQHPYRCTAEIAHALGMNTVQGRHHVSCRLSDLKKAGRMDYTRLGRLWFVVPQEGS